jgi:serine phosphatase RsbU (regulator of sigma subunit)
MIRGFIVDDEEPARDRLRRLLSGAAAADVSGAGNAIGIEGIEIVGEAADGADALPQIAALTPDVVFLDIQMPGLSGLDVAARLEPPRPRVIFCTAFDQFAIDAFEHHAVDYLLKPINRDRLMRTVARISGEVAEQRRQLRDDARRITEQREAERTQARLMPLSGQTLEGLDCAGTCRPALGIGGDYYDFLRLDADSVGLTLGDISGKGTYAGLLVAALQARMQALVSRGIHDPAGILRELNALTAGTMEGHRFATVAFAAYHRTRKRLAYSSAGHPPAVVVSTGGAVRQLESTGPAIGWEAAQTFGEVEVIVQPGDVFALCSDGVTETVSPSGDLFGTERLAHVLQSSRHRPAAEIVVEVMSALERFSEGAPAEDDRTLVVARVL